MLTICQSILIHSYYLVILLAITFSPTRKNVLITVKDNRKNTQLTFYFNYGSTLKKLFQTTVLARAIFFFF